MTAMQSEQTAVQNRADQVPQIAPPRLPYHPTIQERFGIDRASWKAMVEAIFPNAQSVDSVILALSYCRARKLDPFKRNVHIVPIWNRDLKRMVDTIWPGIGELRTTAFRTGEYAGRDAAVFGPDLTQKVGSMEVTFPEWAQVTVYRMVKGNRVAFAGPRVYWLETYATRSRDDDSPNEMWANRTRGQIEKCAEAAALRAGFPEEVGSDHIADEVQHPMKQVESTSTPPAPKGTAALLDKLAPATQTPQEPQAADPTPEPTQTGEAQQEGPSEREQAIIQLEERYFAANPKGAKESVDAADKRFMRWASNTGGRPFSKWEELSDEEAQAVYVACNDALKE